jgi:hypothetical protein
MDINDVLLRVKEFALDAWDRVKELPPKYFIIGGGGLAAVLILVVIVAVATESVISKPAEAPVAAPLVERPVVDEYYLGEEPDFAPGVVLEDKPAGDWGYNDGLRYWYAPRVGYSVEMFEADVDEIMESVP